jgi:hypothetical protein
MEPVELVDCPYCKNGGDMHYNYCGICLGKKKVNAHFVKWLEDWKNECRRVEDEMRAKIERDIDAKLNEWSKEHPEPPKF